MVEKINMETLETAMRAALIIEQQEEILNEALKEIATEIGVSKSIAKKIVKAYAKDQLEKTQEKLEEQRQSLTNAEMLIEIVENASVDTSDIEDLIKKPGDETIMD